MADENEEVDFDSPEFEAAIEEARSRSNAPAIEEEHQEPLIDDKPPVTEPKQPDAPTDPAKPNYAEYLSTVTEGFIKDEDTLKSLLPKVKGYDDLETKLKDTEAKIPKFSNPETEALFNLWTSGDKKAVLDYIRETEKDYTTMSDIDVQREAIKKEHPNWSKADVELELRGKYGDNLEKKDLSAIDKELEPDEYKEAVEYNKEVEKNLLQLQLHARDNRYKLIEEQSKIQLPEIKQAAAPAPPEQNTPEEIADYNAKWVKNVEENLPKLSNIKMNIDNKEVEYVRSDDDKAATTEYMKTFNIFKMAKELGWIDENKKLNPLKIAEDRDKMVNFDKIVTSIATQVKTDTTKTVIKQIKNVDDEYRTTDSDVAFDTLEDAAWDAIDKYRAKRRAAQQD